MSILTNRLKISFHLDAIKEDFIFIRLTREQEGKWWGAEELDRLIDDYQAMSVGYAKYAYAMFEKKTTDVYDLRQRLRHDANFSKVAAIEVNPEATYNGNDECICGTTLARLLMNSLGSSRSRFKHLHFSNLTGALLKVPSLKEKLYDPIGVAEISLISDDGQKNEFLLNVSVFTYRKKISILKEYRNADETRKAELKKVLKRPEYIFHSGTACLIRWLPSNGAEADATKTYIKCGKQHKRLHTNFLEFGSIENFDNSRAGIFHQTVKSFQEHLSKYMDVQLSVREAEHTIELSNTILKRPSQLHAKLDGQPIHIVDRVGNEESANLATTLKESFLPYITDQQLITFGKRDKEEALNFRIIHNAAYYEKLKQKDEYLPSTNSIQRQHLTIESTGTMSEAITKTIIKELLIKRDISSGTLSLFDWNNLEPKGIWTFASWDENTDAVIFMEIQPNGSFKFREIDGQDIFNYQEYQKYIELMTEKRFGKITKKQNLEGLVISERGDINLIFCTDEISLPNLAKIEAIIKEVDTELPENTRSGNILAHIVEEFFQKQSGMDIEKFKLFLAELRKIESQTISKREFKSLIAQYLGTKKKDGNYVSSTIEATCFRDYLLDQHQIRLKFPQDNQNKEDLFDASLNIKYFGETEKESYYFVGERKEKAKFSFKDACHLRKIVAVNGSKLIFRQLLPTMNVDFVRTGQSTVVPFPFKYIREYKNFADEL